MKAKIHQLGFALAAIGVFVQALSLGFATRLQALERMQARNLRRGR